MADFQVALHDLGVVGRGDVELERTPTAAASVERRTQALEVGSDGTAHDDEEVVLSRW